MIDADLLLEDNIHPEPVDEVGMAISLSNNPKYIGYAKSNISMKKNTHQLNIPPVSTLINLEQEYEERVYENINNLGKYIIQIIFANEFELNRYIEYIDKYLCKYPHILITNTKGKVIYSIDNVESRIKDLINSTTSFENIDRH